MTERVFFGVLRFGATGYILLGQTAYNNAPGWAWNPAGRCD